MKNMLKKTLVMGSLSAILSAGFIVPASASPADDLSAQLQQWFQNNGYTVNMSNGTTTITKTVIKDYSEKDKAKTKTANPSSGKQTTNQGNQKASKSVTKQQTQTQNTNSGAGQSTDSNAQLSKSQFAAEVVKLVNNERSQKGLKPLTSNAKLTEVALAKAKDMSTNNYFSHTSPTYGSPFDMMKKFGVTYTYAGENIAMGQKTPQEVMKAWMNSQGHRENILKAEYTQIGVAYYNGYWVQEFTRN
ncbi:CAP domain-containing protein [Paenibacillus polymyxa]|uniref:Scp-like extracellular protein n=1 Tax=Paenibacillus polymyxa TaxID=1406 RepID=A0A378XZG8_PAEPO|nr:CAP domain-containing protein [Paenibacillus polymyxa]MBE7896346.1 serine protease [Paenibacillus polymyxa]MBG9765741.1 serine protease [Paenibacillus polymyxa]MCC3256875.1 CAP domain-containing protein [Paenibacillus polymyxa]PNQ83479.1 serine protease [Paenibacillus polymyxa]QPK54648.1 serine protease [Paenibacillus polymyxa]